MRVIPVVDLLGGRVVRGVAGERHNYKPLKSLITRSTEPLEVARAIKQCLAISTIYLADLDAILGGRPNHALYANLARDGFSCLIDAGARDAAAVRDVLGHGAAAAVVGLETWPGPDELAALYRQVPARRLVFSLDLKQGVPCVATAAWNTRDPFEIARRAMLAGATRLLVLDLANVGVPGGVGTLDLCRRLRAAEPALEVITGGGVRGAADLHLLESAGIDGALVASAIHDGRLTRGDILKFLA